MNRLVADLMRVSNRWLAATIVALFVCVAGGTAVAHDFSYDNLMIARMKMDEGFDYEAFAESYMQVFRPVVYKSYRDDEFQFRKKKKETIELMKKAAKNFDLTKDFTINTTMTLGKYDFDKQEFPVIQATDTHYWYKNRPRYGSDLPSSYKIFFSNHDLIRTVPMPEERAGEFIAQRKDRSGRINRVVQCTLKFRIERIRTSNQEFSVTIESAKFYDDKGRTRQIHQIERPKKPKKKADEKKDVKEGDPETKQDDTETDGATESTETPTAVE